MCIRDRYRVLNVCFFTFSIVIILCDNFFYIVAFNFFSFKGFVIVLQTSVHSVLHGASLFFFPIPLFSRTFVSILYFFIGTSTNTFIPCHYWLLLLLEPCTFILSCWTQTSWLLRITSLTYESWYRTGNGKVVFTIWKYILCCPFLTCVCVNVMYECVNSV